MANSASTIALEADPNDPEDRPVTFEAVEKALAERRARLRGPQREPTKRQVTLRLDQDLLDHFRAGGRGWQTRLNDTLRGASGL